MGFSPRMGNTLPPINVKFGTEEAYVLCDRRSTPPHQILRLSGQKCGNAAPKIVKIWNFAHRFAPAGPTCLHTFYEILSVSTRL